MSNTNNLISLEKIISYLPGHVYWTDQNNRYLGCNDLHAKSAGLKSRQDVIGKTNKDLAWANQADYLNTINDKVRSTAKEYCEEEVALVANGETRVFISKKAPLLDENNNVVGVLVRHPLNSVLSF